MSGREELRALVEEMRAALAFYADPDSYRNRPLDEQRELLGGDDPTISVRGDFAANAPPGCALSDIQMDRRGHRARTALTRAESSLASPAGMEGWMPIETADKDADQLLLGIVRKGRLEEVHLGGYRYAYNDDEVSCWWSDQADDEICPTHWCNVIPLPAASHGEAK